MKINNLSLILLILAFIYGCSNGLPKMQKGKHLKTSVGYFNNKNGDSTKQYVVRFFSNNPGHYIYEEYHTNGMLASLCLYVENKLDNIYIVKDSLGNCLNFGVINNGNGLVRSFYPDGKIKFEGKYIDGCREGYWREYDLQGIIQDSCNYVKGICLENGEIEYNKY